MFARLPRMNRRGIPPIKGAVAAGFVPPAGLVFWGDPDAAYITKDGSNRVSNWVDRNAGVQALTQGTAADKPLWSATSINGHPGITFAVANTEYMVSSSAGIADFVSGADKPLTVIAMMQFVTAAVATRIAFGWGSTGGNNPQLYLANDATAHYVQNKRDDVVAQVNLVSTQTIDTANYHVVTFKHTGTTSTVYTDGVVTSINASASDLGVATLNRFAIGALFKAGAASHSDILMGQFLAFDSALGDTDRGLVETYLTGFYT